jgi:hypothetical protein
MAHKALRVMDERCPLGLKSLPTSVCPLAAERLRALRNSPNDPKAEQVGCSWYIADRPSNYCFFKYVHDNEGQGHETIEIAALLHATQANVHANLGKAIEKVKDAGLGDVLLGEEG